MITRNIVKVKASNTLLLISITLLVALPLHLTAGHPAVASPSSSLLLNDRFIKDARGAIDLLYNREYDASLEHLSHWKQQYPDHPLWSFWEAMDAWWPVLVDLENTTHDDAFLEISEKVVSHCTTLLEENSEHLDARVIRSITYGQIARYYSNRYRWYPGFRNGRRALRDFHFIEERYPDIPDLNFGIGMYRYFSSFLVDEYILARPLKWMLPSGDREEGLSRLKQAADSSIFLEPEAVFFLGHIYLHFEQEPGQSLEYLEELYQKYPNNTYYRRLYVRSLFQLRRTRSADMAIKESLDYFNNDNRHDVRVLREDLYTIRGRIHFHYRQYDRAESDFLSAVEIAENLPPFATRSNLITALYYLGEISVRNDDMVMARYYFRRAATPDTDHTYRKKSREALQKHRLE